MSAILLAIYIRVKGIRCKSDMLLLKTKGSLEITTTVPLGDHLMSK